MDLVLIKKAIDACCGWPVVQDSKTRFCDNWGCSDVQRMVDELERLNALLSAKQFKGEPGCNFCSNGGRYLLKQIARLNNIEYAARQVLSMDIEGFSGIAHLADLQEAIDAKAE